MSGEFNGHFTKADPIEIHARSASAGKIALFRSLFKGREDVYPRRFESRKTGRAGYAPACGNEWVRGICEKPRIKCGDCPHRAFLPVTDEVIRWHLSGKDKSGQDFVAGIYPMMADETCYFLAMDFDKESWHEDVHAVMETGRRLEIPAALERSRSGNGGHVWLFFTEAVPATLARKLGSFILTETMERRPELGLASYDRLFPNQDTLPKGGFGNLIALPMQKGPRERSNSMFVDETFTPWADPWAFLSSVQRLSRDRIEVIVQDAENRGRVVGVRFALSTDDEPEPWNSPPSRRHRDPPLTGPLPKEIEVVLGDGIYLAKGSLSPALRNRLLRLAAFQNPEFYRAQAMRLPTYEKPRIIACGENLPTNIGLPRGCLEEILTLFTELKIKPLIRDLRMAGTPLDLHFTGTLRPEQETAAAAILAHDTGVLSTTTAFGKTVLAAHLIAVRGANTLILVHRQQLLEQWIERISLPFPPPRIPAGNHWPVPAQCETPDPLRRLERDGDRPVMRRSQARHRDRRTTTSIRSSGLPQRPAQGRVAPGERLPCPPVSSRRPRKTSGCHARRHPARRHAPSAEAIVVPARDRHYVDFVPKLFQKFPAPDRHGRIHREKTGAAGVCETPDEDKGVPRHLPRPPAHRQEPFDRALRQLCGACSWQFHLKALPLGDCTAFWGKQAARVSPAEKWRMLSVTGGVPGYLEQLMPSRSAEENIERLCFNQGGMLFHEFERIFHDIFTRRAGTCQDIVSALVSGLKTLEAWDTIIGYQFETLVLDSLDEVFERLGLKNRAVLNAGPYAQGKTLRQQACQIDLLIRTRQAIYVCEMKFRRKIGSGVIEDVREKVARLKLPKVQSVRTVLIHSGEMDPTIEPSDYFDFIINADEWVMG